MRERDVAFLDFGPFRLDLARELLTRDGTVRSLRSQSFRVLYYLAEHAAVPASASDIVAKVWPSPPAHVDASVAQCIKDIRRALGPEHEWMIRTVKGIGYQFVPTFTAHADDGVTDEQVSPAGRKVAEPETIVDADPSQSFARFGDLLTRSRLIAMSTVPLVLLALLIVRDNLRVSNPRSVPSSEVAPMTMMAAPTVAFLAAEVGMEAAAAKGSTLSSELAAEFQRAPRGYDAKIEVQDRPAASIELARLTSRYAVAPAIVSKDDADSIVIQLFEVPTRRMLWAKSFTQRGGDLNSRNILAAEIARLLAVEIRRVEALRPLPADVRAGHLSLMGRLLLENERYMPRFDEALALFDRAVEADASHLQSLLGYARSRLNIVGNGSRPQKVRAAFLIEAQEAIRRVLEIDRLHPGGYLLRGLLERLKGNHLASLASLEYAKELNPNYAPIYGEMGRTLIDMGRHEEAIRSIQLALERSPSDPIARTWYYWMGMAKIYLGQNDDAAQWLNKSMQADAGLAGRHPWLALALARVGRLQPARDVVAEYLGQHPKFTIERWQRHFGQGRPALKAQLEVMMEELASLGVPRREPPLIARRRDP